MNTDKKQRLNEIAHMDADDNALRLEFAKMRVIRVELGFLFHPCSSVFIRG
jgi:hypothetical protein